MDKKFLQDDITNLLKKAAKRLNLYKFTINLDLNCHTDSGFLSETYRASIIEQTTNQKFQLFIKRAPKMKIKRNEILAGEIFHNETLFYSEILPAFEKFQRIKNVPRIFDNTPSYIISQMDFCKETIILEDVIKKGFQMRNRDFVLDHDHLKLVFETFGRFHALSFCLKQQNPEKYDNLVEKIHKNLFELLSKKEPGYCMEKMVEKAFNLLEEGPLKEKFRRYAKNFREEYFQLIKYQGKYSCFLHGDSWTNNMLFKYQDSKLLDVKFVDFQLSWIGTPVYDLSFCFYCGGSKSLFDALEDYLDIYYASFSKFAKQLGNDPDELLPREELSKEWKQYGKFGMLMSIPLTHIKLLSEKQSVKVSAAIGDPQSEDYLIYAKVDDDIFKRKVEDVLQHMSEIGAL